MSHGIDLYAREQSISIRTRLIWLCVRVPTFAMIAKLMQPPTTAFAWTTDASGVVSDGFE
jgi:hypothetical protein